MTPEPAYEAAHTVGRGDPRRHRILVMWLIIGGAVVGVLATIALWAGRQAFQTDAWTETSRKLLADPEIQTAVSAYLVDELFTSVDVRAQLQQTLPANAQGLAIPASAGLRALADRAAPLALQRPRVQQLWAEANRVAHRTLMAAVRGGSDVLSTAGGVITLNLRPIVERVGERVGLELGDRLPPDAGIIEVMHADRLARVQSAAHILAPLAVGLPILALGLFALAVYLARGWRSEALERVGFAFLAVGALILVARAVVGGSVVDSLGVAPAVEPAARSVWEVGTSLLRASAIALIGYGLVIMLGSWLASSSSAAMRTRERIGPVLRDRWLAYGGLAFIVVLVLWWNPTPGTDRWLPALLLIALAVVGLEALRRVSLRDVSREPPRPVLGTTTTTVPPGRRAG